MKKLLFTIILSTLTLFAVAQDDDAKYTLGIMGGANMAFLQTQLPAGSAVANNPISIFSFGLNLDFRLNDYLSIRPGVFYSGKGGDVQFVSPNLNGFDQTIESRISLHYLEVPVTIVGHIPLSDSFRILIGAGPYASLALNGKARTAVPTIGTETDKVTFGSKGNFNSTDFGATGLIGFETQNGIMLTFNYDAGIGNILKKNTLYGVFESIKTGAAYVSIGYSFQ